MEYELTFEIFEEITGETRIIKSETYLAVKDEIMSLAGCNYVTVKNSDGNVIDRFYVENLG